jgi:hypothetical protein
MGACGTLRLATCVKRVERYSVLVEAVKETPCAREAGECGEVRADLGWGLGVSVYVYVFR